MTTTKDLVNEQICDLLLAMKMQRMLTKDEYDALFEQYTRLIDYFVDDRKAKEEQVEWHFTHGVHI